MLRYLSPPRQLIQACSLCIVSSGTCAPEVFIVVVTLSNDVAALTLNRCLIREVIEIHLAKRAEVEPVITHPTVNHRAHWRGDFQRGMGIDQSHHHGEALVRTA